MSKLGTAPIDSGTTQEPAGNHLGTGCVQNPHGPFRGRGPEPVARAVLNRLSRKDKADNSTARRIFRERVIAGEILAPRTVRPSKETRKAVSLYRREKARKVRRDAKLIAAAKLELARLDELAKLARRGGRPRKVR